MDDQNCKCKCGACGAETPMQGEACATCTCGAGMEKVCEPAAAPAAPEAPAAPAAPEAPAAPAEGGDENMAEAEEQSENGDEGGCCS